MSNNSESSRTNGSLRVQIVEIDGVNLPFLMFDPPWDMGQSSGTDLKKTIAAAVERRKNMSEEERLEEDCENKRLEQTLLSTSSADNTPT